MAKTTSERLKKLFDISGIWLYYFLAKRASPSCWGPLCQFDLHKITWLLCPSFTFMVFSFLSHEQQQDRDASSSYLGWKHWHPHPQKGGAVGVEGEGALRLCELTELPGSAPRQVSESKQHICDSICNGACHKSLSVIPPLPLIYLPPRLPGRANSCAATQNHPHSAGVNCKPMAGVKSPLANP